MQNKVRIVIGPNGSGKSTIKNILVNQLNLNFGYFINADEIQKLLNSKKVIENNLNINNNDKNTFIKNHSLNKKYNLNTLIEKVIFNSTIIKLNNYKINSYESAVIADLFRTYCLKQKINFSYESVFSDVSKISFVKQLKKNNYKIYLYIVSTLNPEINKSRVKYRVSNKGHSVPENKIEERYYKSLINIKKVIPLSHRAFIIDNSQNENPILIAEVLNGKNVVYKNQHYQPYWVKNIIKL